MVQRLHSPMLTVVHVRSRVRRDGVWPGQWEETHGGVRQKQGGQEGVAAVSLGSSSSQHQKLLQYFREQNKGSV